MKKKRAALYIRVSTTEQAEKYGKDLQFNQMKKWLGANDQYSWSEKHVYVDEGFSGASMIEDREALPKLFEAAKKGEFEVVIVWKLDRFFRKTQYLLNAIAQLDEMGIGFLATTQPEINTTGPVGKVVLVLMAAIAEMERDLILERTGAGRVEAADAGKWVGGKYPPYGYDVDPEKQNMSINKDEEKIVRQIFNWFVRDKWKLYQIQQRLNAGKDIPTKADTKADEMRQAKTLKKEMRTKHAANFWHLPTIRRILKQQAYTGIYYYGKKTTKYDPIRKKKIEVMNPFEKWTPVRCIPIISQEMWDTAQELLKKNKELSSKNSTRDYLLSGKIICSQCGSPYVGYIQPKWKVVNGVKKRWGEYQNYRCRKNNKEKSAEPCHNRQISAKLVEEHVWAEIEELLQDPKAYIEEVQQQERKDLNLDELEAEKKQLVEVVQKKLDADYERACNLYEIGSKYQGEGEMKKRYDQYVTDTGKVQAQLNLICSQLLDAEAKRERIASAKEIAERYAKTLSNIDFKLMKEIAQTLINQIVIYEMDVDVQFAFPRPSKRKRKGKNKGLTGDTNQSNPYGVTGQD